MRKEFRGIPIARCACVRNAAVGSLSRLALAGSAKNAKAIMPRRLKFWLLIEGELMTQASSTFTVTVKPQATPPPPPKPVRIVDATLNGELPDEMEGVTTDDAVATVMDGVPPYSYAVTGLPEGVTLNETMASDGSASASITTQGVPNVGDAGEYTITLTVTDSAIPPTSATLQSRKIS
jgi:hypothetical protein